MTIWFVTRHAGAKAWAYSQGINVDRLVDHLDLNEVKQGDQILGTLPVNLVAEINNKGAQYFHLTLPLPPELRGKEISVQLMQELGAKLEEFIVIKKEREL